MPLLITEKHWGNMPLLITEKHWRNMPLLIAEKHWRNMPLLIANRWRNHPGATARHTLQLHPLAKKKKRFDYSTQL